MEDWIAYPLECSPTDAIAPGPEGAQLPLFHVGVAPDPDIPEVPATNFLDE